MARKKTAKTAPGKRTKNTLLTDLLKASGNEYGGLAEDFFEEYDCQEYMDTGSYSLNMLTSGSLWGGLSRNKITAIAGEESTGKTFLVLGIVKNFLEKDPKNIVIYWESEGAITKQVLKAHDIPTDRVIINPVETIEQFRTQLVNVVNQYNGSGDEGQLLTVLDSLGNLSTKKEVEDIEKGSEKKDMTRSGLIRGTFRALTLKLSRAKIPLIITNHTYEVVGSYIKTKEMAGGGGVKYAASTIIFLSKKKDKDNDKLVVGNIVRAVQTKSRISKENRQVFTRILYEKGLDKYYGLVELGLQSGVLKQISKKVIFPDGSTAFKTTVEKDPEKYFTKEVLEQIEQTVAPHFQYGMGKDDFEFEATEE